VRLPPGEYRVRKRESDHFLVLDISLRPGDVSRISDADMQVLPYETQRTKGAVQTVGLRRHGPRIETGVRNGLIDEMGLTWELRAGYRFGWNLLVVEPRFVYRLAQIDNTSFDPDYQETTHSEYDLGLLFGIWKDVGLVDLLLGLDVGLVLFDSDRPDPPESVDPPEGTVPSLGLQSCILAGLAYRIAGGLAVFINGSLGLSLFKQGSDSKTSFVYGASLGLAYDFLE